MFGAFGGDTPHREPLREEFVREVEYPRAGLGGLFRSSIVSAGRFRRKMIFIRLFLYFFAKYPLETSGWFCLLIIRNASR